MIIHISFTFVACPSKYKEWNDDCYMISTSSMTWSNAKLECNKGGDGYDLVVVKSKAENDFIKSHILNDKQYWIGLKGHVSYHEGKHYMKYTWVDSSPFTFGNEHGEYPWDINKPNKVATAASFEKNVFDCNMSVLICRLHYLEKNTNRKKNYYF